MISFKEPELADREWMVECLSHALSLNCEYTFGNIYVWRTAYVTRVCHYKDFLLIRYGRGNDVGYLLQLELAIIRTPAYRFLRTLKRAVLNLAFWALPIYIATFLSSIFPVCSLMNITRVTTIIFMI